MTNAAKIKFQSSASTCHPQKARFAKGLCSACYNRERLSDPIKRQNARNSKRKWMKTHPERHAAASMRRYYQNHEYNKQRNRTYWKAHPHLRKKAALRRYGMSLDDYDLLFLKQNGLCALCGFEEKNGKSLSVDHCHETGNVRSLLCGSCNGGLGLFDDDELLLHKAIEYLRLHNKEKTT